MTNTDRRYFEEMYESDPDPWGFSTSWYEQRKYSLTMAALPASRYRSVFEPGCSIGVLTSLLASRCDRLLASDVVPSAVEQARRRLRDFPHVRLERSAIPEDWPADTFDLIVLSEIAYYFDADTLGRIVGLVTSTISRGGTLVGVHWRGATNYPLRAEAAHEIIDSHPHLRRTVHHTEPDVVLDVWQSTS